MGTLPPIGILITGEFNACSIAFTTGSTAGSSIATCAALTNFAYRLLFASSYGKMKEKLGERLERFLYHRVQAFKEQVHPLTIELKPEQERIIQEQIRSGHFRSAEEVLDYALAALREKNSFSKPEPKKPRKNFAQFLMESPLSGSGLDLERDKDQGRDIEL
jgi:Arc/MetJ-type ribon-helix-helix transcriptional regulator